VLLQVPFLSGLQGFGEIRTLFAAEVCNFADFIVLLLIPLSIMQFQGAQNRLEMAKLSIFKNIHVHYMG
jgi:hypothetical protein